MPLTARTWTELLEYIGLKRQTNERASFETSFSKSYETSFSQSYETAITFHSYS
jgi:hypothetical protein